MGPIDLPFFQQIVYFAFSKHNMCPKSFSWYIWTTVSDIWILLPTRCIRYLVLLSKRYIGFLLQMDGLLDEAIVLYTNHENVLTNSHLIRKDPVAIFALLEQLGEL